MFEKAKNSPLIGLLQRFFQKTLGAPKTLWAEANEITNVKHQHLKNVWYQEKFYVFW